MTFAAHSFMGTAGSGGGSTAKYNGTISCGFTSTGWPADLAIYGFSTDFGVGSRLPTTVSAHSFTELFDLYSGGGFGSSTLRLTGFGADPLTGFISSVTANGVTQSPSGYSYSTGTADWTFSSPFNFPSSGAVAATMVGS